MAALFRTSLLLQRTSTNAPSILHRNIGMSGVVWAKLDKNADPIQRLFAEKLQTYKQKSKDSGKLVGVTPEMETEIEREMGQIKRRFGGGKFRGIPQVWFYWEMNGSLLDGLWWVKLFEKRKEHLECRQLHNPWLSSIRFLP